MVIQLNLVRGINTVLDLLADEIAGGPAPPLPPPPSAGDSDVSDDDGDGAARGAHPLIYSPSLGSISGPSPSSSGAGGSTSASGGASGGGAGGVARMGGRYRLLKLRLAPLRTVQRDLEVRIGVQAGEDAADAAGMGMGMGAGMGSPPGSPLLGPGGRRQEFFVRSATSWKRSHGRGASDGGGGAGGAGGAGGGQGAGRRSKEVQTRETAEILAGCADDMQAIWEDPTVREFLARKGVRMEATPGL